MGIMSMLRRRFVRRKGILIWGVWLGIFRYIAWEGIVNKLGTDSENLWD